MSGLLGSVFPIAAPLAGTAQTLARASGIDFGPVAFLLGNQRKIDTIVPDVVITEHHVDRLQVTQHPIATGTPISDHAYMLPVTITMQCGFSNSNILQAAISGFTGGGGFGNIGGGLAGLAGINPAATGFGDVLTGGGLLGSFTEQRTKQVYESLQKLQKQITTPKTGKTITVLTGKRKYVNMAITELSVTTDRHSEFALFVTVTMTEVIVVKEQTATAPSAEQTTIPEKAAPTAQTGEPQVNPADSELSRLFPTRPAWVPAGPLFNPSWPSGGGTPAPPHRVAMMRGP